MPIESRVFKLYGSPRAKQLHLRSGTWPSDHGRSTSLLLYFINKSFSALPWIITASLKSRATANFAWLYFEDIFVEETLQTPCSCLLTRYFIRILQISSRKKKFHKARHSPNRYVAEIQLIFMHIFFQRQLFPLKMIVCGTLTYYL